MLDLKIVDEDQYDLVPVPLPGRLIVFAGPDGLMCRRNDGTITNYPAPAEGGGGGAGGAVSAVEFVPYSFAGDVQVPEIGHYNIAMVGQDLVIKYNGGAVVRVSDGALIYDPNA